VLLVLVLLVLLLLLLLQIASCAAHMATYCCYAKYAAAATAQAADYSTALLPALLHNANLLLEAARLAASSILAAHIRPVAVAAVGLLLAGLAAAVLRCSLAGNLNSLGQSQRCSAAAA
jgi:hypothetical protein